MEASVGGNTVGRDGKFAKDLMDYNITKAVGNTTIYQYQTKFIVA